MKGVAVEREIRRRREKEYTWREHTQNRQCV